MYFLSRIILLLAVYIPVIFMYPAVISWEHKITVDWENGTDNQSCLQGDVPCASFNMALKGLTSNSTVIYISSGNYTLESGSECDIIGKDHIAIVGSEDTVIRCDSMTGISVLFSDSVRLESIIFNSCGKPSTSLSIVFGSAAVEIRGCINVVVKNVFLKFSSGTALIISVSDNVTVDSCLITDSRPNNRDRSLYYVIGGGIWLIGDNRSYAVINTTIINNQCELYYPVTFCPTILGGGIIVTFIKHSVLTIDSCTIVNNSRGINFDIVESSTVVIKHSTISSDQNISTLNLDDYVASYSVIRFINTDMTDTLYIGGHQLLYLYSTTYYNDGYKILFNKSQITFAKHKNISFGHVMLVESQCSFTGRGTCSESNYEDHTGHCPIAYSSCLGSFCFCDDNHRGRLCGQCKEGYSVSVNSPYLSCVPCDAQQTVNKGWAVLLGLEFVPLTLMMLIIIVLDVNLTQGSLNTYIFLCQILTISFPSVTYPSWMVAKYIYADRKFLLIPFSMWNLDWINVLPYHRSSPDLEWEHESTGISICISSSTTPLGAILFWYLISFYPLLVLLALYTIVILYNRGYKVLVCWLRPLHRLMARLWRLFDVHPSLSHSVASIYTLCFTQLAATSLKLLHPTWYRDDSGNVVTVFFYDGSQRYFQGWHIPAVIAAILVLIGLIVITLYLSLYSFQLFQKCLNKLKFRKDFLISLTDVFMAPYKNGTDNTFDYRWFAGVRFSLLLIIMTFYYIPQNDQTLSVIPILELATCSAYICTIIIFRPYRRVIHTFTEAALFSILGLFACPFFFHNPEQEFYEDVDSYWYKRLILPVLGVVLLLVVIPYCLVWLIKSVFQQNSHLLVSSLENYTELQDSHLADRLINPQNYGSISHCVQEN